MKHYPLPFCLLWLTLYALAQDPLPASEFQLEGDYLIGGLFDIHLASGSVYHDKPEVIDCSRQRFILSSYRRFQLMRFTVEEINNSTTLLPNVSLGYEIFDHCSNTQTFPGSLSFISVNGLIQPWGEPQKQQRQNADMSKVMAVVGPFSSTHTLTVAPFFMFDLLPMVISNQLDCLQLFITRSHRKWKLSLLILPQVNYGGSSSVFSQKSIFPSLLRTVHPNNDVIEAIVNILLHFNWRWVAFLNSDNDFGIDGLELFIEMIKDTEICLAYTKGLDTNTDNFAVLQQIEAQSIPIIIVFASEQNAAALIKSAIHMNIRNKVWIAGDEWSLSKSLPKVKGIRNIGTVLGVAEAVVAIPGFSDFISASVNVSHCKNVTQQRISCNQACNCSNVSPDDVIAANPSFSFPVYSAVYAIAHALHRVLQCGSDRCNGNITVYPHMVLAELKKSNFVLLNHNITFDQNGDRKFGFQSIVYWNDRGDTELVGYCEIHPAINFFINETKIQWYMKGEVPTSLCSPECPAGHAKKADGIHKCCFTCEVCPKGTYVNSTADAYRCVHCKETEWSAEGSTSCSVREVEYVPFTDTGAILIMVGALVFVALTLAMSVLFAINYNTPVVRSAGGPMCFLILGCLSLSSLSVFFYFDKPTVSFCILRFLPFLLFYTVCLACFAVRSFQIVCIFKMASKFPKLHRCWMKYQGQWLTIAGITVIQTVILIFTYSLDPPKPHNETVWYPNKIILDCDISLRTMSGCVILLFSLSFLCFIFSYLGKDLPKNYNEAKSITFCLLLLILTWIIFATVFGLYRGKYIQILNALAVLSSLYSFLLWYFFTKCYIVIFQPHKNTQQYFQGLIQGYTKTISH